MKSIVLIKRDLKVMRSYINEFFKFFTILYGVSFSILFSNRINISFSIIFLQLNLILHQSIINILEYPLFLKVRLYLLQWVSILLLVYLVRSNQWNRISLLNHVNDWFSIQTLIQLIWIFWFLLIWLLLFFYWWIIKH